MKKIVYKNLTVILLILLVQSCVEGKSKKGRSQKKVLELSTKNDTLTFKTGIRAILLDSEGNYWFGSHQEGICKFDGESFKYFTIKDGLPGNQILTLQEDSYGTIWISTNNGICYIQDTTIKKVFPVKDYSLSSKSLKIQKNDVWASDGNEIVKTEGKKIYSLQNPFFHKKGTYPNDFGITSFTNGINGNVWLGTYSGVFGYNGSFHTLLSDSTLHYDGEKQYMHVRSIYEDTKGRLWIGNNGIGVLLKTKDSIVNFSKKMGLNVGSPSDYPAKQHSLIHVFSIGEDAKGNIWFGDRDTGAWMYNGHEMKNFEIDSTLGSKHIWCIYNDKHGNLLFGMAEKGVYKYHDSKFIRVF